MTSVDTFTGRFSAPDASPESVLLVWGRPV
jgi:hypothetical protein